MPLPKRLKIGVLQYKVREVKELTKGKAKLLLDGEEDHRMWGLSSQGTTEIYVEEELAPIVKKVTLLHEALHAILDQTVYANDPQQENIVKSLEHGLYDVIVHNPNFIKYLQEK